MGESGPADATAGTTVEVRDLFFNTPARAKFLKSPATEQAAIVRVVTQLALANPAGPRAPPRERARPPERARGRRPPGAGRRALRVRAGAAAPRRDGRGWRARALAGVVAPPALARTHRDDIHFIVNGRVVRDTLLTQALLEAYRPLLPRDQFPLAALELDVRPERGRRQRPSRQDVGALPPPAGALRRRARRRAGGAPPAGRGAGGPGRAARGRRDGPGRRSSPARPGGAAGARLGGGDPAQASLFREGEAGYRQRALLRARRRPDRGHVHRGPHAPTRCSSSTSTSPTSACSSSGCAASSSAARSPSQELLFPQPLELAPARLRALERVAPGARAARVRARGIRRRRDAPARGALAPPDRGPRRGSPTSSRGSSTRTRGRASSPVLDRLLAFVACRAAIKAHQPLAPEEMAQVLTDLGGDRHALLLPARTADRLADPARGDQARAPPDLVTPCPRARRRRRPSRSSRSSARRASARRALAVALGEHWPIEVVSVDSRQVYRRMDIGTAKPTPEERRAVRHHLVDVVEPDDGYDAARFAREAAAAIEAARSRGRLAGPGRRHGSLLPRARPRASAAASGGPGPPGLAPGRGARGGP